MKAYRLGTTNTGCIVLPMFGALRTDGGEISAVKCQLFDSCCSVLSKSTLKDRWKCGSTLQ